LVLSVYFFSKFHAFLVAYLRHVDLFSDTLYLQFPG